MSKKSKTPNLDAYVNADCSYWKITYRLNKNDKDYFEQWFKAKDYLQAIDAYLHYDLHDLYPTIEIIVR